MKHTAPREFAPQEQLNDLSAEEYFRLLHPPEGRGIATVFCKFEGKTVKNHTLDREGLLVQMPLFVDQVSYLTLNRFRGKRRGERLAGLNALYVDLDCYKCPEWRGADPAKVQAALLDRLAERGVPQPSIVLFSGRGIAAIWLIAETPKSALPRWRGAMRALTKLVSGFGVDKRCKDTARVFRIPGTVNEKSGRQVRVIGGTGCRHDFDTLADQFYTANGQPTRAELDARRKQPKPRRSTASKMPRGLTHAQRFALILEDLEAFREFHGGLIPVGMRNTWLHFYATCLTHLADVTDIDKTVQHMATLATPGLPPCEVKAIASQAVEKSKLGKENSVWSDGRYHYRGATIAESLGVSAELARELGLKQVIPEVERKQRKAEAETKRRREKGALAREDYLQENSASRDRPWLKLGFGRTKYYALKRAGKLPPPASG